MIEKKGGSVETCVNFYSSLGLELVSPPNPLPASLNGESAFQLAK